MRVGLPCSEFRLENGLRLIIHEERSAPLVSVNIWYHVGSRDEEAGRTGLAHLFEHLMFEGSANVPPGEFDRLLESAGGINNGSTTPDRTNYWETVPSNAVELALFLEADRMGGLLAALSPERFDAQRDVVMNERRENYENRPYGMVHERLLAALYPAGHPYHWPVIGFMPDIEAATLDDAATFCRAFYSPSNASLAVAGDIDVERVHAMVEKLFGPIAARPAPMRRTAEQPALSADIRLEMEDKVQLPRLYMAWHSPAAFTDNDAEMDAIASALAAGKASRLYRELITAELAVDVCAFQHGGQIGSTFEVIATARPGQSLESLEEVVRDQIRDIAHNGITIPELDRVRNGFATAFIDELQTVGGFGGRADRLNLYAHHLDQPDSVQADLDRYLNLDPERVRSAAGRYLDSANVLVFNVMPTERPKPARGATA